MARQSILWTELAAGRYAMSAGRVHQVADALMAGARTAELNELVALLFDDNASVAMRAADVLERISARPTPAVTRLLARNKAAAGSAHRGDTEEEPLEPCHPHGPAALDCGRGPAGGRLSGAVAGGFLIDYQDGGAAGAGGYGADGSVAAAGGAGCAADSRTVRDAGDAGADAAPAGCAGAGAGRAAQATASLPSH